MDKTICSNISEKILSGEVQSPEILAHRRECAECDALAQVWETVRNTPAEMPEVPENLDRFIRAAAKHRLAQRHADSRKKYFFLWLGSAAAVFAVAFASMFLLPESGESSVRTVAGESAAVQPGQTVAASDWDFTDLNFGLAAMSGELESDSASFNPAQNAAATQLEYDYVVYAESKNFY